MILLLNGYTNDTSLLYRAEEQLREVAALEPRLPSLVSSFAAVYVSQGSVDVEGEAYREGQLVVLEPAADAVRIAD